MPDTLKDLIAERTGNRLAHMVPPISAHDLEVYTRMVENLRTRHYAVGAQEAADAISSLLFHVKRLSVLNEAA